MNDQTKRQAPRWVMWTIAGSVALILMAYPLSIGPTLWLWRETGNQEEWLETIKAVYWPILWMKEKSSVAEACYFWYIHLWV